MYDELRAATGRDGQSARCWSSTRERAMRFGPSVAVRWSISHRGRRAADVVAPARLPVGADCEAEMRLAADVDRMASRPLVTTVRVRGGAA